MAAANTNGRSAYGNEPEWAEIREPASSSLMYANLDTGECRWEPPPHARVRIMNDRQWWELFDARTNKHYYYNAATRQTVWRRPENVADADIIPLTKLQGVGSSRESQTQTAVSTPLSSARESISSRSDRRSDRYNAHNGTSERSRDGESKAREDDKRSSSQFKTSSIASQGIIYAQDIGPETGIVTLREPPHGGEQMFGAFRGMSLTRGSGGGELLESTARSEFVGEASIIGTEISRGQAPGGSPVERSYDTGSYAGSISRGNRFPYDSSSPTRSLVERHSVDDDGGEGWSKDAPKAPLADPSSKTLKKEASSLFKHIQSYMGDRKSKNNPDQLALSVCESAVGRSECADEACLLLMKQLTRNERSQSVRLGWELLAILLALAAPSDKVASQVASFAERHSDRLLDPPHVKISQFAAQVIRRLAKSTSRPKPSLASVHEARVHIFHPPQFGTCIEELMEMQADRFPHLRIPWIENTLVDLILNAGGSSTEGIFRVAADPEQLATAKARLDQWLVPAVSDAHVAACLLKAWLRELPDPLIPSSMYERALEAGEHPQEACRIAERLPGMNTLVLARLIWLLQVLAKEECVAHTKMDASNLAMVIAPNILRCESQDMRVLYENTRKEMAFCRTLILHYDTSFASTV